METTNCSVGFLILDRVIAHNTQPLTVEVARFLLALRFSDAERESINALAERARDGELSDAEMADAQGYERVGHLLASLHARARTALKTISTAVAVR